MLALILSKEPDSSSSLFCCRLASYAKEEGGTEELSETIVSFVRLLVGSSGVSRKQKLTSFLRLFRLFICCYFVRKGNACHFPWKVETRSNPASGLVLVLHALHLN